jgi:hypothetical protein
MPTCQFSQDDLLRANADWGCNCGPAALAFAVERSLDDVRTAVMDAGFAEKRRTTPTLMQRSLEHLRVRTFAIKPPVRTNEGGLDVETLFNPVVAIVRVQWTGAWTKRGAPVRVLYQHTHWIATWSERGVPLVFDVNGGVQSMHEWESQTVPAILEQHKGSDGGWFPTHVWRIAK